MAIPLYTMTILPLLGTCHYMSALCFVFSINVDCSYCNLTLEIVNSDLLLNGTSCVGCVGSCVIGVFPTGLDSRAYMTFMRKYLYG
jgi:hypothetical protein